MYSGACLCGAVTFEVDGPLNPPDACHCIECRKHSGHVLVSTDVPRTSVTIYGEDSITWYQNGERVRRGFCSICGSSLFFLPIFKDWIGISMGAFDQPTDTKLALHIFVSQKGDYYEITDDLPQNQR